MALTRFQQTVCRLLAEYRVRSGESYVAGGVALNELLDGKRISRDIDLFHDTEEAVEASWAADRARLEEAGYRVRVLRERPGFVEAEVAKDEDAVRMEWAQDSAYRFFPLVEHPDLGLALHPFDLATNKLLALIGRREVRDWIDILQCDATVQPIGYLAWAAPGKDPGFSPPSIVEHLGRSGRFAAEEITELAFSEPPPEPAELARRWHTALDTARELLDVLPPEQVGTCVLLRSHQLCRLPPDDLSRALEHDEIRFHTGSIRGALPTPR
jgi:hypothetical protein